MTQYCESLVYRPYNCILYKPRVSHHNHTIARLLECNGPRADITVTKGNEHSWVGRWAEVVSNYTDTCRTSVIYKHKSEVAYLGYSLIGPRKIIASAALKPNYVTPLSQNNRNWMHCGKCRHGMRCGTW